MEQRRLRLGDILDDYCPRERRVTNHAVVAMIEEDVKQTRCTTCDAEHPYKGGKAPRRRNERTRPAPSTRKCWPASLIPNRRPRLSSHPPRITPSPPNQSPACRHLRRSRAGRPRGWRGVARRAGRTARACGRRRRGPGPSSAHSGDAAEHRRAEGRTARTGVHHPPAWWTAQRELPRRRSRPSPITAPAADSSATAAGQRYRQSLRRRARQRQPGPQQPGPRPGRRRPLLGAAAGPGRPQALPLTSRAAVRTGMPDGRISATRSPSAAG